MHEAVRKQLDAMLRAIRDGGRHGYHPDLPRGETDADEVAVFLAKYLKAAGLRTRLRLVSMRPGAEFHHVFVEVWYPPAEKWLALDPNRPLPPPGAVKDHIEPVDPE